MEMPIGDERKLFEKFGGHWSFCGAIFTLFETFGDICSVKCKIFCSAAVKS